MKQINDRFSFDKVFRRLLKKEFASDEALEWILCKFSLGPIVFQERIENKYYFKICKDDKISKDLEDYKDEMFKEILLNKLTKIIN